MKLQKFNRALFGALLISGALGMTSQAHATLSITPSSTPVIFVNTTPNLDAAAVTSLVNSTWSLNVQLGLAFKQDFGGGESGSGAPYYSATISPASDPSAATITWDGPLKISCPSCFLTVKDGAQGNPAQYVFDISGWNGTDTINLSGFWAGTQGSISNIAIWNAAADSGSNPAGTLVPEPETYAMLLAGLGLVGFAARRKLA